MSSFLAFIGWMLAFLVPQPTPPPPPSPPLPTPPVPGYSLVWSDEFGGQTVDPAKWKPWAPGKRRDAFNTATAARLDGQGHLVISTTAVTVDGETRYETGGVWTRGLFEPTFGYFEARVRFQSRMGHWGAFWLNCGAMGQPAGRPGEAGVEMDVIEFHHKMRNQAGQRTAQQTLHWDGYGADHKSKGRTPALTFNPADDFHVYAMLWTSEEYVFLIDGIETWRVGTKDGAGVSSRAEYLILSLEMGTWAGKPRAEEFPDSMVVDWVRVWQKATAEEAGGPEGAK